MNVDAGSGLAGSLSALASTLIAILRTRLELLCLDLEDERDFLYRLLITTVAAAFTLSLGILLAVITLVVLFWETHRLLTLGLMTGLFLLTGTGLCLWLVQQKRNRPGFLSASLKEIARDIGEYRAEE